MTKAASAAVATYLVEVYVLDVCGSQRRRAPLSCVETDRFRSHTKNSPNTRYRYPVFGNYGQTTRRRLGRHSILLTYGGDEFAGVLRDPQGGGPDQWLSTKTGRF
jgi:hypothetical protein